MISYPKSDDNAVMQKLVEACNELRQNKPVTRSEKARRYTVTITEMEKVMAYFKVFIGDADPAEIERET